MSVAKPYYDRIKKGLLIVKKKKNTYARWNMPIGGQAGRNNTIYHKRARLSETVTTGLDNVNV